MSTISQRDPFCIFLSGSTDDFGSVRLVLKQALERGQLHIIHQADFPQTPADTVLKLAQLIAPCGVLVHLIGRQPGAVANAAAVREYLAYAENEGGFLHRLPDLRTALGDCSGLTYTQWEVFIALHLGIDVFVYGDATHADPAHPQRLHIDRLRSARRYTDSFTDASDLKDKIWAALIWHYRQTVPSAQLPEIFRPSNLPGGYTNRIFLGRDEFLGKVRASLLSQTGATAITQSAGSNFQAPAATSLNGLGGIGKTHAAVEYAHRYRGDYTALLFVSGENPERLRSTLSGLCGVLHLDAQGNLPLDEPSRVTAAVEWLSSHRDWLLIVDNVDDEAAATELTALLSQFTNGHVLITSRLHGWSDNVDALDLSVLSPEAATDLLRALAKDRRGDKTTDHAPARLLADLLEGLPLAIQQAAGYINEQRLSFEQALDYYQEQATELLGWFNSLTIPYQAPEQVGPLPVLFTWKSSFDKLAPDTRRWLRVFAHYAPAPIPEFLLESRPEHSDQVKARHRAALAALAQAEKYSLLTRDPEQPQFKLHRLVQQIIRLSASEAERAAALVEGIRLIKGSAPGDPTDVRTWPRWNPLQAHAQALCNFTPDDYATEDVGDLLGALAQLIETKGLFVDSEPLKRRALAILEARVGHDHPTTATHINNFAQLLKATNRSAEAEPLMRRALGIWETSLGEDHPAVAISLNNLAGLLKATNRLAEAEPLMRRALAIDEASFGKDDPNVAIRLNNLAGLLKATNRLAEAEPLMRRVLVIWEASLGEDHPNVATSLNNLAQLLQDTNRLAEAEPLMRRALSIDEASFGKGHPNVAIRLSNLAGLLQDTNRLAEAEPLMRRVAGILENKGGDALPNYAVALNNLAQLLVATNRLAEAEPLMRRALGIDEASYGPDHPNVARDLNNLARLLQATNRHAEAEPLMRRQLLIFAQFTAHNGHEHPHLQAACRNYHGLLEATGLTEEQARDSVLSALREVGLEVPG